MENRKFISLMRKVAITACIMAFLACLLTGCKTTHEIQTEYVDRYVHDSVFIERVDTLVKVDVQRDSVLLRDSVFVNVWQSADTIFKIKEVWKYRNRISVKHDTIKDVQIDVRYIEHVDTAFVDKVSIKTEYVKKPLSWWQRFLVWAGGGCVSLFVCGLLLWLRK